MRWKTGRRSDNVVDARRGSGRRVGRTAKVGGGAALIAIVGALLFGPEIGKILGGAAPQPVGPAIETTAQPGAPPADPAADFVSVVLADTEDTWGSIFATAGKSYQTPKLVLYNDMIQSACGTGSAAVGPFYCPGDSQVYLDLDFLGELQRLGADGDFAVAYVIAHEIGHHVQNQLGTAQAVQQIQQQVSRTDANALSVLNELQADCYAGVWAHHAHRQRQILERGDIEEGMRAAAAVGDDRLQRMSGRGVHPETFTHGSSEQRVEWFKTGLSSGDVNACNTFLEASG